MTAGKEKWTEEQCKNKEKELTAGHSKEAYSSLKALTKTQQRKSKVSKTAVETGGPGTAEAFTTTNSNLTPAYSRAMRPPQERLKYYQC